jgi:hypothetical protein
MTPTASRITITGQRVTFERGPMGWVATGWEKGLPVARRPVAESYLREIVARFDPALVTIG